MPSPTRSRRLKRVDLVDNVTLRAAVAEFAGKSEQSTYLEVIRALLQGDLLLDATGSKLAMSDDGSTIQKGSTFAFHEGTGPDGQRALFAFTRQQEIARMHPDAPDAVQSLAQPAPATLEFAASQGYSWLYIDPAGPTCGIQLSDAGFVLRNPRNDAVKAAIAAGGRDAVLDALASGGILFYAVNEMPEGLEVRTSTGPDGGAVRLAFTSPAEVAVRSVGDAFAAIDIVRIVDDALEPPFVGLVINPAGPWIALRHDELVTLKARLAEAR